jgi:oligopeptide/dipeptide ABC transporter ATP-binding protein
MGKRQEAEFFMGAMIEFKNYSMGFKDDDGKVSNLLDRISISVEAGKALGIVGESGCGKSMTSLSMMRLLPEAAVVQGGEILFEGKNILEMGEEEITDLRGNRISMIFQEPMTALNPVLTIGFQIGEAVRLHYPKKKSNEIRKMVIDVLEEVGIANAETRLNQYPHEFSGGMRQRVMIAMAVINHPDLLIADEPTTALDVTVQAQILDIMNKLKGTGGLVVITHNLGIVAEICEAVVVMYAGRAVERGTLKAVFDHPLHPYTKGLMASIPTIRSSKKPLYTIPGTVPTIYNFGSGCRFADRCDYCMQRCKEEVPPTKQVGADHLVQCWLELEGEEIRNG